MANVNVTREMIANAIETANNAKDMTQAKALAWLITNTPNVPADVMESAERLLVSKTKKYERKTTGVNKTRLENERLVPVVVEFIKEHENDLVNSSFIASYINNPMIMHPQKATAICAIAIEMGLVERYEFKKRPYYAIPGTRPSCVTE